jgi:hypothetical protein
MSSPRRLPPAIEPDLPQDPNALLDPGEEPVPAEVLNGSLPGEDSRFYNDMYNDSGAAPQEVIDDVLPEVRRAEPAPREVTSSTMDLSFINKLNDPNLTQEQAAAEYNKLPPALRYVYDRVADFSYNNADTQTPAQLDPRDANRWLDEFYQTQDRIALQQQGPQAQSLQKLQAEKAQKTVEMSNDILSIMDRLRGFKKGEEGSEKKTPKYFGRVGTFDSLLPAATSGDRAGWYIDHKTLEDTLALAEAQANRGQGNFTETERLMLRSAATGGLNYGRDDASYAQIFEGMYDMFKNKAEEQKAIASPAQSAPAAAAPQTKKVGNQTWVRTPDGWLPQR